MAALSNVLCVRCVLGSNASPPRSSQLCKVGFAVLGLLNKSYQLQLASMCPVCEVPEGWCLLGPECLQPSASHMLEFENSYVEM
jgi:hypothetical protein